MLDHYLHTASHAHQLLNPYHDEPIELPPPRSGVTVGRLDSHDNALAWFSAERLDLLTALRWARDAGLGTEAWQLVWALTPFLEYQGYWHEWQSALETRHEPGEPGHRALNTRLLGRALVRLRRFDEANVHLNTALAIYTDLDDAIGMAHTHRDLCWKLDLEGDHEAALPHAERAYELFRAAGHRAGEARSLNAIGWFNIAFGRYETALAQCREALRVQREIDDRFAQAETLDSLGKAYRHLGDTRRAVDCYEQAHALYHEFDDRFNEADTLDNLAEAHVAAGDSGAAADAWNRALRILDRLHHPDADRIRMRLDSLSAATRRPDPALVPIS
jgi:tetratricopeptide (TPR) repeat protein